MSLQATKQGQCFDFVLQCSAAEKPNSYAGAQVTAGQGLIGTADTAEGSGCVGAQ